MSQRDAPRIPVGLAKVLAAVILAGGLVVALVVIGLVAVAVAT